MTLHLVILFVKCTLQIVLLFEICTLQIVCFYTNYSSSNNKNPIVF
jgi:hypothetical protein